MQFSTPKIAWMSAVTTTGGSSLASPSDSASMKEMLRRARWCSVGEHGRVGQG